MNRGMKIGFTGTRHGMNEYQAKTVRALLTLATSVSHGDCIGADAQCHEIAKYLNQIITIHPPISDVFRANCVGDIIMEPDEYLARNRAIVDSTDMLIAAPFDDTKVGGTWYTISYASKQGKAVVIVGREGDIVPLNMGPRSIACLYGILQLRRHNENQEAK